MVDVAAGEAECQPTVSGRCWSVILTCEASEGRVSAEPMPGLPYSCIWILAASSLIYDILPAPEGF